MDYLGIRPEHRIVGVIGVPSFGYSAAHGQDLHDSTPVFQLLSDLFWEVFHLLRCHVQFFRT